MDDLDSAMSDFKDAMDKESLGTTPVFDCSELIQLGKLYFKNGKISDACVFHNNTVKKNLERSSYCLRGLCLAESGKLDEAVSDFKETMSKVSNTGKEVVEAPVHENCEPELIHVAGKLFENEKFDEALWCYSEAIKETPSALYYAKRGDCYMKLKNTDAAITEYKTALSISPNSEEIWSTFLKMMFSSTDKTARVATDEMYNSPVDSAVLSKVAAKLYKDDTWKGPNKYSHIDRICSQAIAKNNNNAECHELRGLTNAYFGNHTMAIQYFEKASQLDPSLEEKNTQYITQLKDRLRGY